MAIVSLQRVSYNFGPAWALRDVDLELAKGEFLFLTGPSGAGKTTLLRLLYGDLPLKGGQAEVCGYDLARLTRRQAPHLRRQIGVVFQDFKVLPRKTAAENVAMALEVRGMAGEKVQRRVRAVLRVLEIEDKADVRCERLAGGEQQRVAIARSVVVNPGLILADEPTGNLDFGLTRRLMTIFKQFHAYGTTVIMATHNQEVLSLVPGARVLHLDHGHAAGEDREPAPAPRAPAPEAHP